MSLSAEPKFNDEDSKVQEPWKGLASYIEDDKDLFFGREKEVDEILSLLRREVLTILFGPSGTGKTSVLNAGLFPRLRGEYMFPIPLRLDHLSAGANLMRQVRLAMDEEILKHSVEKSFIRDPNDAAEETLWEYLNRIELWDKRNNAITPVFVFDQFEEIFTLGWNKPEVDAFIADLSAVVENYIPNSVRERIERGNENKLLAESNRNYKVMITLREDFVSRLDSLRKTMPSVMHNRFSLGKMNGQQALDPVLMPGRMIVTEAVAEQIVRRVASGEHHSSETTPPLETLVIEPALLSLLCTELNARRIHSSQATITPDLVNNASADILSDFYERAFKGLNEKARPFVEDQLLTADGFRTTVALDAASKAGLSKDISILTERRLLRREERLGIPHIELTHDVLTSVAQRSRSERQEREARIVEQKRQLTLERKRRDKFNRWLISATVAAAVFLVCGVGALILYRMARQDREAALKARNDLLAYRIAIEIQPMQQTHRDDTLSYLLLKTAASLNPSEPLLGNALWSVSSLPYSVHAVRSGMEQLSDVKMSPRGDSLAAVGIGAHVYVWSDVKPQMPQPICTSGFCTSLAWSPNSELVAFGEKDGFVNVWDIDQNRSLLRYRRHTDKVTGIAWKNNDEFATASLDGKALVWSIKKTPSSPFAMPGLAKSLWSVAFSHDGRIAVGGFKALGVSDVNGHSWVFSTRQLNIVSSVAWSSDDHLASGGWSGTIDVFDKTLNRIASYTLPSKRRVYAVAWVNQDSSIAVGSADPTMTLLNLQDGAYKAQQLYGTAGPTKALSASAFGSSFAQIADDQYVRLWARKPKASVATLSAHQAPISVIKWSQDGKLLLSGAQDGRVVVWNTSEPESTAAILGGPIIPINDLISLRSEPPLILGVGGWTDRSQKRTDASNKSGLTTWLPGSRVRKLATYKWSNYRDFQSLAPYVTHVALAPDGILLAAGTADGQILILGKDGTKWKPFGKPFVVSTNAIESVSWKSPDLLTTADSKGASYGIHPSGTSFPLDQRSYECSSSLSIAKAGALVAVACGHSIRIESGANAAANQPQLRRELATINASTTVTTLNFSSSGRWLAYGSVDGHLGIFDSENPSFRYYAIPAHNGAVTAIAWSPDEKSLATGGSDVEIHIWNPPYPFHIEPCEFVNRGYEGDEWQHYVGYGLAVTDPCGKTKN